jgi:hypothetical protein
MYDLGLQESSNFLLYDILYYKARGLGIGSLE